MRISDWSSDVCSSDLCLQRPHGQDDGRAGARRVAPSELEGAHLGGGPDEDEGAADDGVDRDRSAGAAVGGVVAVVAEHVHVALGDRLPRDRWPGGAAPGPVGVFEARSSALYDALPGTDALPGEAEAE